MTHMLRKQIYIPKRQQVILKRLAKARGLSEAEIIRQAIEREVDCQRRSTCRRRSLGAGRFHPLWSGPSGHVRFHAAHLDPRRADMTNA